jgi:hypothetical protein
VYLARRAAAALLERRKAARFRRFVAPPEAPVSVGEALSKLRKGGRGLGGLGRWFPVGAGGTTTKIDLPQHAHAHTSPAVRGGSFHTLAYPGPSHSSQMARSSGSWAPAAREAGVGSNDGAGGGVGRGGAGGGVGGGLKPIWGRPYGEGYGGGAVRSWADSRAEEQRRGMREAGGDVDVATAFPSLSRGGYGTGGAGVLGAGWEGGDKGKSRQTDATLYDFSSGHWGKMRSASDLLLH